MKKAVRLFTITSLTFLVLLSVRGLVPPLFSDVLYCAAVILPLAVAHKGALELRREREEMRGLCEPPERLFSLDARRAATLLPLVAPSVALIFLTAYLSSIAMGALGLGSDPMPEGNLALLLVTSALVPAVLEELVFRYSAMRLLLPYSARGFVILSALYFALAHASLYKLPYALVGGFILALVASISGSVLPSIVIHFINNALSIVWSTCCDGRVEKIVFISILSTLVVISFTFIAIKHKKYKELFVKSMEIGEPVPRTYAPLALLLAAAFIMVINLL